MHLKLSSGDASKVAGSLLIATINLLLLCSPAETKPHILLEKDLEPFDATKLLPDTKLDNLDLDNLGPISLVGTILARPNVFPVWFGICSRESCQTDLKFGGQVEHEVTIRGDNDLQERKNLKRSYHFELDKLMPNVSSFKANRRTVVLIPGYSNEEQSLWFERIIKLWIELEDVNVISVDWSLGCNASISYDTAVSHTKIVARQITILLYYLSELSEWQSFAGAQFRESISLVGHSLGAHVAAFVGQELAGEVGRITGLDPAGVIFDRLAAGQTLSWRDGKFVDVLHTNAGKMDYNPPLADLFRKMTVSTDKKHFLHRFSHKMADTILSAYLANSPDHLPRFGIDRPSGHVDYYANGGSLQPGCPADFFHVGCDHNRAIQIYLSALEWEKQARKELSLSSIQMGAHRLVAFPSKSYELFKSGISLFENCPQLLTRLGFDLSDEQLRQSYRQCSIPIDFLAPGKEFSNELERHFNIQLELAAESETDRPSGPSESRFYFETLSKEPFVSEHHLLRIHLGRPFTFEKDGQFVEQNKWDSGCTLKGVSTAALDPKLTSTFEYSNFEVPLKEIRQNELPFYGLVMPYANPIDWRYSFPTAYEIKLLDRQYEPLRVYLAHSFSINIDYTGPSNGRPASNVTQSNSTIKKALDSISGLMLPKEEPCRLTVLAVESLPLVGLMPNISSWFTEVEEDCLVVLAGEEFEPGKQLNDLKSAVKLASSAMGSSTDWSLATVGLNEQLPARIFQTITDDS